MFLPASNSDVLVVCAPVTDVDTDVPLFPIERYREISECSNPSVKREKYLVWKLLERVVKERYNLDFENIMFTKNENGKWICPDFFFSLSHSFDLLCVAISDMPVGVDVERMRDFSTRLAERVMTDDELRYGLSLDCTERDRFFLECWVKKESIFKMKGDKTLSPRKINTLDSTAQVTSSRIGKDEYLVSVASLCSEKYELIYVEEI